MNNQAIESFPESFSPLEQCQVLAILAEVDNTVRAYEGDFSAPWLLSPIHSNEWRIRKGAETRFVDGDLTDFYTYQWATKLHDGSNLIDAKNRNLLHGMQRLAFLAREMPGGPTTLTTHKGFLWSLNFFVRWAFVRGDILNPRKHALTKITHQHLADFFIELGKGGTVFALRYPEKFLQAVFPLALARSPTEQELDDSLHLPIEVCTKVSKWLYENGHMRNMKRSAVGEMAIRNRFIADLIGVDVDTVNGGAKWHAFIGQFNLYQGRSKAHEDYIGSSSRQELPSHKALSIEELSNAGVSEKTLGKYFDDIRTIVALHRHLPDFCPDPLAFKPRVLRQVIVGASDSSKHTPWIPLPVAMSYTSEALRWVHVYGDALVDTFLHAYRNLRTRGLLVSAPVPEKENPTKGDYVTAYRAAMAGRETYVANLALPDALAPLRISGWGCYTPINGVKAFEKLRQAPSLLDAIMILVGAITVVVTMVKPMRESEFRALKRDCLIFFAGDGYWLTQDNRKKNFEDVRPEDARPIPVIAAKAIELLRRLTDGLKDSAGITDPWLLDSLLTLPTFGRYEAEIKAVSYAHLAMTLNAFCDFVALPADEFGRRWYLRIHEMRKSFLITFFWTYRFANLDAARWIAGHGDAAHVYAYIQANFPGEELPNLEAEYASKVLRDYQESGSPANTRDVEALYRTVCSHFSVRDVSWIDESILQDWLAFQFQTREFEIIPYSIKSPDGRVTTEIAFRISSINRDQNG